jgi:hypothetical protein
MMRTFIRTSWLVGAFTLVAQSASAQIVQSLNVNFGAFLPRGFDSRVAGDVLVADLTTGQPLTFDIGEFKGWTLSGEWNVAFNDRFEVSGGVGYYNQKVNSLYRDLVNGHFTEETFDDTEIEQRLHLRMMPITFVARFLPVGRASTVQPYIGAGVAVIPFRYAEVGDFVDTTDGTVFPARYITTGTAVGPVFLGGLRMPLGGDIYSLTFEGRYQWASGDTGGTTAEFLGDKIDLSGGTVNFGFLIRF